jgi:hypothetical protein
MEQNEQNEQSELTAHRLGTDAEGHALYSPESAPALDARGVSYWADEDGILHAE